jgi:hypothetical protein
VREKVHRIALSGGEATSTANRRRVRDAQSVAQRADLLFADETVVLDADLGVVAPTEPAEHVELDQDALPKIVSLAGHGCIVVRSGRTT